MKDDKIQIYINTSKFSYFILHLCLIQFENAKFSLFCFCLKIFIPFSQNAIFNSNQPYKKAFHSWTKIVKYFREQLHTEISL